MAILVSQLANTGTYTLASDDTSNKFFGMATVAETLNFSGTGNLEILDASDWDVLNLTSVDPTQQTINIKKSGNSIILTAGSQTFTLGALADGEHITVNLGSGGTPPSLAISRTGDDFFYGGSRAIVDADTTLSFATITTTAAITGVTDNAGLVTGTLSSGGVTDDTSLSLAGTISATLSAGQVVAIYDGVTRLGTAAVSTTNWTYADTRTLTDAQALSYTVRVETTTGLQGTASSAFTLTVDTQAPATTIATYAISADTDTASDFITSTAAQTVSGTLSANLATGERVQISFDETNWTNATVTVGQTAWSAAAQTLSLGANTLSVQVVDAAGNVGTTGTQTITLVPKITWTGSGFIEATANDGTIDATAITATVANATLKTSGLSASDFTVTGLPTGLSLSVARTSDTVASFTLTGTATAHENTNDVSNLTIAFKDSAFTQTVMASTAENNTSSNLTIDFADAAPVPAVVTAVTSSKTNGSYKAGEVIDITVSFDKAVTVTGTPILQLSTGGSPNATASYDATLDASDTDEYVTFKYTVGAGEHTADLNYLATNSLALSGGTISDANGAAVLTLPATSDAASLAGSKAIVIDTVVPNAPTGLDLATEDDTGAVTNDNITKNTTGLTISGAAEAGSTVSIYDTDGTTVLGTGTATGGNFSIDIPLAAGTHSFTAKTADAAGNVSTASTALSVTVDTGLPAVTVNTATVSQIMANDAITSTIVTLTGSGFNSLKTSSSSTDVKAQLDWAQFKSDSDYNGTVDTGAVLANAVTSASIGSDTSLILSLATTEAMPEAIIIGDTFWVDAAGNIQADDTTPFTSAVLTATDRQLTLNMTSATPVTLPASGANDVVINVSNGISAAVNISNLTVVSTLTINTLGAGNSITITGATAGLSNITSTVAGNLIAALNSGAIDAVVMGGDGNDEIDLGGSSGAGAMGNAGNDTFIFTNLPVTNAVTIADFTTTEDKLRFDLSNLQALTGYAANGTNPLTATTGIHANNFVSGAGTTAANAAYAQFIYDTDTGDLYFDADGTGSTTAQLIVNLVGATLANTDFVLID